MRYLHIRRFNAMGDYSPKGGITVAYDTVGEGLEEDVIFATAVCSKADTFNKEKGRKIAEGRWDKYMQRAPTKLQVVRLNGRKPFVAIMEFLGLKRSVNGSENQQG